MDHHYYELPYIYENKNMVDEIWQTPAMFVNWFNKTQFFKRWLPWHINTGENSTLDILASKDRSSEEGKAKEENLSGG